MKFSFFGRRPGVASLTAALCGVLLGGCRREFRLVLFNNTDDQITFRRRAADLRPVVVLACTGGDVTGLSTDDLTIERNGRTLHYRYPASYTYLSEKLPSGYERSVRRLGQVLCLQLAPDNRIYLLREKESYTGFRHPAQPPGFPLVPR